MSRKAIIHPCVNALVEHIKPAIDIGSVAVLTSGGFDPIHVGHVRCIYGMRKFGDTRIVIVNGDGFLLRKKGYVFMPAAERAELVAHIKGVTDVLIWDDGTQYVDKVIDIIKPDVFCKGGDRSRPEDVAECEREICSRNGVRIEYGVGGSTKVQSSSMLVNKSKG